MCSSGIPVLTVLPSNTTRVFLHLHQAGTPGSPVQPIWRSPRARKVAVVELERELGHQGRHLLAQVGVETDVLDLELVYGEVEPSGVFENDPPSRELHGSATELEIDIVHGHLAVVEDEPAVYVFHGKLDGAARVETRLRGPCHLQAHIRLGPWHDLDMRVIGLARRDVDLGFDVASCPMG